MKNRIITISREFGSGGRTIGREVAEKLGIPCYDSEIIERLAEESGFSKEYIKNESEYAAYGTMLVNLISSHSFSTVTNQDKLWFAQRDIILDLAQKGSCVIVGRCADVILKDKADCLNVFIHSDFEKRAKRIVEVYGERDESSEKRLKDKDKRRAAYYQFYTERQWGDVHNYDIALNSGVIGIEKCVEIITSLY